MMIAEGWPALMSTEMAARYLSVEESKFVDLASFFKTPAVEVDSISIRWRKQDLDRLIKQLPSIASMQIPRQPTRLMRLDDAQIEEIAKAVARRLEGSATHSDRKLVSIREAGTILGVGRSSVYRMMEDGRLATTRIGRRTLIHMDAIQSIIAGA